MGFDNECIVNIQSLAGEYFCPVCRLLVDPNEALQSQCTHLYCKPCLSYIANNSRACPYDGYLVTEADSKLLTESNKALAETIGKVLVHCLYHRSGCTWQGPLSECLNHCPGCAFGNSPVVCNRCAIQIVHRQVLEHAQTCPGVQTQPPAEGSQLAGVANATDPSLNLKNAGNSNSQAPVSQTVLPGPVSNSNLQMASAQVPVPGHTVVPTSEQWYQQQQQQYQQYYQQFVGYNQYQQQYYPYQVQQSQTFGQPLVPSVSQTQPQSQVQPQPQPQPLVQGQPPVQQQLILQPQPHAPTVATAPPPNTKVQSTMPPPSQLQSLVQSSQPATLSFTQLASKPAHFPNQPFMQAPMQASLNQQSQVQMPQPAVQPMMNSTLQLQPNTISQIPSQTYQAAAIPHHLPANQQVIPQTQVQYPLLQTVLGYQSYPQPQPVPGAPQTLPMIVQQNSQPHLAQTQQQFLQPSPQVRPFRSNAAIPHQQQSSISPSPAQLPGIPPLQKQPMHPQSQLPGLPVPQRPVTQQYSQQISVPQKQPFGGHSAVVQTQSSVHEQLPLQSQFCPPGPPSFPPKMQHGAFPQHQPNGSSSVDLRAPNQPPNLIGRPALTSGGLPLMFPQMDGPANSFSMSVGFNPNNILNSRGEVQPPSEQRPSKNFHSQQEKNSNGQNVDLLSKASIGRDDTSSSLRNDDQESASLNDAKDVAKRVAAHGITDINQLDGRLDNDGDLNDVPAAKYEENTVQEDKKLMNGFTQSQEDEKPGVHMVTTLKGFGNETKPVCPSGQEEKKLAHAQALVNSFGQETGRQHVVHPSQPDIATDHEQSGNPQHRIGPSSAPYTIDSSPVGPSHLPHFSGPPTSHQVASDSERNLPWRDRKTGHGDSFGVMHDSAPSGMVGKPFLPGTDGTMGHRHPNFSLEAEKYFKPRLGYMDRGTPDTRFLGGMESGAFGQPSDIHSNRSRVMGPAAVDPVLDSFPGDRSDRSFELPYRRHHHPSNHTDGRKFQGPHQDAGAVVTFGHFPSGSPLRSRLADKPFTGHNPDWPAQIAASSRNFHPFGPNADMVERPFGHTDDYIQRGSLGRMPFRPFEPVPGQNRRNMDGLPAHGPGRDYPVFPRHSFGDLTGGPSRNLGPELNRGDPYRGSHFFPHNLTHSDFQPGQLGSRHFKVAEPAGLGSSRDLARELGGPELLGKSRLNHQQFLEPRFRSSISPHGFLHDGKYPGDPKSFDNSRKRQTGSMGWCRICKVDCETVEGLEMHSQTREHQKAAIDIVRSIKQKNAKKLKLSSTNQGAADDEEKIKNTSADGSRNKL